MFLLNYDKNLSTVQQENNLNYGLKEIKNALNVCNLVKFLYGRRKWVIVKT